MVLHARIVYAPDHCCAVVPASLTNVFIDNLEPDLDERKFAINRGKQLNDSGLYIVSYLADGKPKRN